MSRYMWIGDAGHALIHPATGAVVALDSETVVDLPDDVAVSPELWAPAESDPVKPTSKTVKKETSR